MCGYDPFYWYEKELDEQYLAYENGFDSVEEYQESLNDNKMNDDYDRYSDDLTDKEKD